MVIKTMLAFRMGQRKAKRIEKGLWTHPFGLSPKATHALERTRPTVCVALTLNLFSFSVGGCRIVIRILSLGSVEAGAGAVARSTLNWGLNFDSTAESVQRTQGQEANDLEDSVD